MKSTHENKEAGTEIRWGIVGAGDASRRFAEGLTHVTGTKLVSVWSRRLTSAQHFSAEFACHAAETLEELLASAVDAIYIGTHPDSHQEHTLAAFGAGRHVLCEKPAMLNEKQLEAVLLAAHIRGLLFMEAMKPPFFPLYRRLRTHLEQDPIGQAGFVRAGSSLADVPPHHSLYNLQAGGGSLLGIAPYEAFLALDWLGPSHAMQTFGSIGPTGIDTFVSLQTQHLHGIAQLYCGLGLHGHGDALIAGPLGNVTIPAKWWNPTHATIRYLDGRVVELNEPIVSTGFNYETEHFCDLLRSGITESPVMTHAMSLQMMRILDQARNQVGLIYPQEM